MTTATLPAVLDDRILHNIRHHASRLHAAMTVPGMERLDLEQDLLADLLHRSRSYDPSRASFRTFADRVVRHRRASLSTPSSKLRGECGWVSIDEVGPDPDDPDSPGTALPDDAPILDEEVGLRLDVRRFVGALPGHLLECCDIVLGDSIAAGATSARVHRSTAYSWIAELRVAAAAAGLGIYIELQPDTCSTLPVSGEETAHGPDSVEMLAKSNLVTTNLAAGEVEVYRWLAEAAAGDVLEYFRGFLLFDLAPFSGRLSESERIELGRVASLLRTAYGGRRVHLLQRRNGCHDYSYFAIARPQPSGRESSR